MTDFAMDPIARTVGTERIQCIAHDVRHGKRLLEANERRPFLMEHNPCSISPYRCLSESAREASLDMRMSTFDLASERRSKFAPTKVTRRAYCMQCL